MTAMPRLKMEVYTLETGVSMILAWNNEEEFNQAKEFLNELLTGDVGLFAPELNKPQFCTVATQQQLEALFDFRRRQRETRQRL
ncbi:MAG: hypothetical protein HY659_00430 [Rhizobiales bacterium]|nr:hypothetical protein [Hyphomicrobiales bacterium]